MGLHHVTQRTGGVVIARATLHAQGFGHRDLHMVDMGRVPDRLEQRIGKAQRHQVLHGFLAEIMVDAIDAAFREMSANGVVDRAGGIEVLADRLLHHQPRLGRQSAGSQALADRHEQIGPGGEVADQNPLGVGKMGRQLGPAFLAGGIDRNVGNARQEPLNGRRLMVAGPHMRADGLARHRPERLAGQVAP